MHLLSTTRPRSLTGRPTRPPFTEAKAAAEAAARARAGPPVVEMLAEGLKAGPLALLHRCFSERRPVSVMVRRIDGCVLALWMDGRMPLFLRRPPSHPIHTIPTNNKNSVRGSLTGQLRAFDRHFNMVLGEATEAVAVAVHPSGPRPFPPSREAGGGKRGQRGEQRKRGCRAGRRRKTKGRRLAGVGKEEEGGGEAATEASRPPLVRYAPSPLPPIPTVGPI